jgi:hypothetical protein
MPCPLKNAGGFLVAGERPSLLEAGWGEKYEGEVADEGDVAWPGERVDVEGRRNRLGRRALGASEGWTS